MKQVISFFGLLFLAGVVGMSTAWVSNSASDMNQLVGVSDEAVQGFKEISVGDLNTMMNNKDFALIKVHSDKDPQIGGTDEYYSPDDIDQLIANHPDKDEKLVIYCRAGNTSRVAAQALIDEGYTDVTSVVGGVTEWISAGCSESGEC